MSNLIDENKELLKKVSELEYQIAAANNQVVTANLTLHGVVVGIIAFVVFAFSIYVRSQS